LGYVVCPESGQRKIGVNIHEYWRKTTQFGREALTTASDTRMLIGSGIDSSMQPNASLDLGRPVQWNSAFPQIAQNATRDQPFISRFTCQSAQHAVGEKIHGSCR